MKTNSNHFQYTRGFFDPFLIIALGPITKKSPFLTIQRSLLYFKEYLFLLSTLFTIVGKLRIFKDRWEIFEKLNGIKPKYTLSSVDLFTWATQLFCFLKLALGEIDSRVHNR